MKSSLNNKIFPTIGSGETNALHRIITACDPILLKSHFNKLYL